VFWSHSPHHGGRAGRRPAGLGVATIVLYLAISLGFQRVLVLQRAHRMQLAGSAAAGKMSAPG
jgi:hypothetical protein